jgi:hypothetical protein
MTDQTTAEGGEGVSLQTHERPDTSAIQKEPQESLPSAHPPDRTSGPAHDDDPVSLANNPIA